MAEELTPTWCLRYFLGMFQSDVSTPRMWGLSLPTLHLGKLRHREGKHLPKVTQRVVVKWGSVTPRKLDFRTHILF